MNGWIVGVGLVILLGLWAWQNRIDLLVWGAPKIRQLTSPVADNVPAGWAVGPAAAAAPPGERPPNVILILTDDMGFNDVSLYNGGAGGAGSAGHELARHADRGGHHCRGPQSGRLLHRPHR